MTDEVQFCPQCGVEMRLRLGEWECPACFHTMAPAQSEAKPAPVRESRYSNVGSSLNTADTGIARGKRQSYRPSYGS